MFQQLAAASQKKMGHWRHGSEKAPIAAIALSFQGHDGLESAADVLEQALA
jgi:hypothetical protein